MRASAPANNNTPPSAHLHLPSYTLKIIMRFIVSRFIPSAEWLFSFSSTKQNKNMKINVELISRLSDNAMRQCAFFFTSFLNGVDDEQSWKCWSSTALLSVKIGFWDATHCIAHNDFVLESNALLLFECQNFKWYSICLFRQANGDWDARRVWAINAKTTQVNSRFFNARLDESHQRKSRNSTEKMRISACVLGVWRNCPKCVCDHALVDAFWKRSECHKKKVCDFNSPGSREEMNGTSFMVLWTKCTWKLFMMDSRHSRHHSRGEKNAENENSSLA